MNDLFYWVYHGAVHKNRTLYRYIHYMHHEIRTPTGGALDTYYEHPLDFVFGTTCALAPLVLTPGIHIFGVFVHLLSNTVIAIADHSGRDISAGWGIFAAVDHDVHHQFGYGNFAQNFSVIDHLFGTHITPLQRAADVTSSPTKSDDLAAVEAVAAAVAASLLANKKPEAVTSNNASAAVPALGMADSDLDTLGVAG
jgi:sterol desaturase/sphingolipid hydroxylase (fatty acid hydroxylase superfamily)